MKVSEFIKNMEPAGNIVDTLNEIITIGELTQPSEEHKRTISSMATVPVEYLRDIYWGMYEDNAVIVSKKDDFIMGYTICVRLDNPMSKEFSSYICPVNLYSWVKDGGNTALNLVRAAIRLAGDIPVMSDIRLSPSAKRFLQKNVESGAINGKVFDLETGQISGYDPDIWVNDDKKRILFMEHQGIGYSRNSLIIEGTWNWRQIQKSSIKDRKIYTS